MPNIKKEEYERLKTIEERYNWIVEQALVGASINSYNPKMLYIRTGVLDEMLRRYHTHDYNKRLHELQAINNRKGNY